MKKLLNISLLAAATMAISPVMAAAPAWDLVEVEYVKIDVDNLNGFDPDGVAINGTKLIDDNFFVTGAYMTTSDDYQGVDVDYDNMEIGLGYRHSISDKTDWFSVISYVDVELEGEGRFGGRASVDDSSMGLSTGLRSMLTEQFELLGDVSYVDINDESETTFTLKGFRKLTVKCTV